MKPPRIQTLFEAEQIQSGVATLGRQVELDQGTSDPLVISLAGGSVVFLADLVRAINSPIRFDFIQVQYASSGADGEILEVHYPISLDVTGQNLLILKDVVASGVIETYLSNQFLDRGARQVRFAALVDVPEDRKTDFVSDYTLFQARRNGVFVGYGLKYRGRYGNLPFIGQVVEAQPGIGASESPL